MRAPAFWWRKPGVAAALLRPLAIVYGGIAAARLQRPGARAAVPVICIGNPTLGGAGKTPTVIAVTEWLAAAGERPVALTRGYGGRLGGPLLVDPRVHTAAAVGDEPLLLAARCRTVVARDRVAGAAFAAAQGASIVVMDDGFQNPSLHKDVAVLVADAVRGLGNGAVFPAGPLRAPLRPQLARAQAVLIIGDGAAAEPLARAAENAGVAVFSAVLRPLPAAATALSGRPLLAFAGIGDPDKFFRMLTAIGAEVRERRPFADHHRYSESEAEELLRRATQEGLTLATTEKDFVRLGATGAQGRLRAAAAVLPVALAVADEEGLRTLLARRIRAA